MSKCISPRQNTSDRAYRAAMNIPTEWEAVWKILPIIMTDAPKKIVGRRPSPSVRYGEKGHPARAPMACVSCFNRLDQPSSLFIPTWMALRSPN